MPIHQPIESDATMRAEIAAILAAGLLRLHQRGPLPAGDPQKTSGIVLKSVPPGLEVRRHTGLSVHGG